MGGAGPGRRVRRGLTGRAEIKRAARSGPSGELARGSRTQDNRVRQTPGLLLSVYPLRGKQDRFQTHGTPPASKERHAGMPICDTSPMADNPPNAVNRNEHSPTLRSLRTAEQPTRPFLHSLWATYEQATSPTGPAKERNTVGQSLGDSRDRRRCVTDNHCHKRK